MNDQPQSPEWLSRGDGRSSDGRFEAQLSAYWMHCPRHGVLVPRGMGKYLECPSCPLSMQHEGHFVRVTFVSAKKELVDLAVSRARACSPALYQTATHDLDIGSEEVAARIERAIEENARNLRQMLRRVFE